ncbi:hypothetical protein [Pseudarthrobacter sp. NPDC058119]|uniref:hypothetical protein n=1 Tax=Pseudarthrobacter sp. NPDC058119 TaxID=3346348 RepID=UPI0036D8DF31
MSTENEVDQRIGQKSTVCIDVLVCTVAVLVVAAACLLLWWMGGGGWLEQPLLNIIGYIGVVISLAGVLLAYLIFRRQSREGKISDRYQRRVLAELQQVLSGVDEKVSNLAVKRASDSIPDTDAEQSTGAEDLWAAFTPESDDSAVYLNSPTGKKRRVYVPSAIPLAVVGALVKIWNEDGHTGRWTLGTLRGAFRAEGKGNHPWYMVFVPPGEEMPIIWKVSRGPGGTDHAVKVTDGQEFR